MSKGVPRGPADAGEAARLIKVNGRLPYLWRAVDQDGNALDIL